MTKITCGNYAVTINEPLSEAAWTSACSVLFDHVWKEQTGEFYSESYLRNIKEQLEEFND